MPPSVAGLHEGLLLGPNDLGRSLFALAHSNSVLVLRRGAPLIMGQSWDDGAYATRQLLGSPTHKPTHNAVSRSFHPIAQPRDRTLPGHAA